MEMALGDVDRGGQAIPRARPLESRGLAGSSADVYRQEESNVRNHAVMQNQSRRHRLWPYGMMVCDIYLPWSLPRFQKHWGCFFQRGGAPSTLGFYIQDSVDFMEADLSRFSLIILQNIWPLERRGSIERWFLQVAHHFIWTCPHATVNLTMR